MGSDKRYRIELTERQLKVVYNALEEWFRISLGQFRRTAERLTIDGKKNVRPEEVESLHAKSTYVARCMDTAYYIATGGELIADETYNNVAIDMWHVLRDEVYYPDSFHLGQLDSTEPPIKVEAFEGDTRA